MPPHEKPDTPEASFAAAADPKPDDPHTGAAAAEEADGTNDDGSAAVSRQSVWHRGHAVFLGSPKRIGVTGIAATIVCTVIAIAVSLLTGGTSSKTLREIVTGARVASAPTTPTPPSSLASAQDLGRYILSRPIWQVAPTTFSDSLDFAFNHQAVGLNGNLKDVAQVATGEAVAYSVSELISEGASLHGEPIYVVARVVSSVESPVSADGWIAESMNDVTLSGPSGPDRVYGLVSAGAGGGPLVGEVEFFRAVVAAVGTSSGGAATTYVISLEDPSSTTLFGVDGADTVDSLAGQFGPTALPP